MTAEFVARTSFNSDRSSASRYIISHLRRQPLYFVTMIIGAFSNAALAAVVPALVGATFNELLADASLAVIGGYALLIGISQIVRGALQLLRNASAEVFAQRMERDVRDELYASLLGKSMRYHDSQPVGETMARVTNDVREMNLMLNPGMNLIVGSGMFLLVPLLVAPFLYFPLIVPPILFIIAYVFVQARYLRNLGPVAQDVRRNFGTMNADAAEALDGLQVVKGSAQEASEISKFNRLADTVGDSITRQGYVEARYLPVLLLGLVIAGGFAYAAGFFRAGLIDEGTVVAFVGQLILFGFPVFVSSFAYSQVSLGYASTQRILEVINAQTDLDQNVEGHDQPIKGSVVLENVDFGYDEAATVLHDISFQVEPGQTVAIVGQTGAGKTTITKLINRTYDVHAGCVLVDGVDVRAWNLAKLRSQISIIEQDIYLFSRSIADNIRFGKPDATQAEIEAAAQKAQAHEFILSFPDGYDTIVGQRGVTLSGGQRQRIALARAFVTDPPILVLDDSTSAIDSATEDRIQKAIWAAAEGRTTLLITHRLSQIRWADQIVVLRQGRVVAQGKHEDLLQTSEAYRRIFARYEADEVTINGHVPEHSPSDSVYEGDVRPE
ncbi:MAG: ABC transporter ATP-binding protein [Chloroflexi bacterium]|nr:ABC transporter ATP-binding protein [Chloroflexota bacterium]